MKLKNTSVYLLAGWMLAACSGGGFQKTENGVVVEVKQQQPTDVRKVRLEVMGEKLIHVSATPEKEFSKEQSLIVIPQQNKTDFKVEEQGDEVTVKTSELCAIVSKTTGEVRFTDADGKQILAEDSDGRTFTPVEVEGTKGYTVRQVFQSAGNDEAFYGLGQHQADEFNYKGKNEELFQYNTKVSVPFIVSNKNYGVLWDSYSLCRGSAAQGYSSGQAMEIMEQIARDHLPDNIGLEWSGLSYQEKKAGGQTGLVLTLVFLFVFLFLAAQYESWTVPIAVLLSLPVTALGAYLGVVICGLENDIYFQIGLVMLVGLAAKNAILIVEFAKVQVDKGGDLIQSAIHAAQLRFRPILMTSLAFVLGMLPMVLASGPGSASRQAIGTGVFFGMIFAIVFGIVLVPFFFVLVYKTKAKVQHKIKKD